jgi:mannan endo-1,4-beta-mannosidase
MRPSSTAYKGFAGLVAGAAMLVLLAGGADAANSGFVRAQGDGFVLNGQPFRFVGTNAYYMAIFTALGSSAHADDQIAVAQALGFTVMRTWGYADGPNEGVGANAFQTAPGVYRPSGPSTTSSTRPTWPASAC